MSRVFAYCRVSTLEQNTENQQREIEAAVFSIRPQRLIEEHISGSASASERPESIRLLDRMENGDVLIVTKLYRLGSNAMGIRKTVEQLAASDICVHCLALGGVDLTSAAGRMTMQVIQQSLNLSGICCLSVRTQGLRGPGLQESALAALLF